MNIKQKIGRGLAGLVLASGITGAAISESGCTTAADAYGQALFENVIIPTAASAVVDEGIRTSIAGPRGTTVNVNNQAPQQQYVQAQQQQALERKTNIFTCISWQDLNKNGKLTDNEIFGRKNIFHVGEKALITFEIIGYEGQRIKKEIISPDGKTYIHEKIIPSNEYTSSTSDIDSQIGIYKAQIYIDDILTNSIIYERDK